MDHYIDIRVCADPEFPASHLMNAVFAKLHRVLVQLSSTDIGASFPEAQADRPGIGSCLRLHGTANRLGHLMEQRWLASMRDFVLVSDIGKVPSTAGLQAVRRVQAKSSPARLRRRQMKRKGWSEEDALRAIPDSAAETLSLPFLTLRSQSTGQPFRLFIRQRPVEALGSGTFNAFGLSSTASLPLF